MLSKLTAEGVGVFFLTFAGSAAMAATKGENLVAIAAANGLALAMAVYATGHVSGGHINPAVTIAMLSRGKIAPLDAALYIVAQLVGACLAVAALKVLIPGEAFDAVRHGATFGSLSHDDEASMQVFGIEAILTFFLVFVIFGVAVDSRGPKNIYGFAIGLTVAFDILAGGAFTGASMNPARSFGPALVGDHWAIHWVYWAGPIAGAVVAAWIYDLLLIGKPSEQRG